MTSDQTTGSLSSEGFPHTYLQEGLTFDVEGVDFEVSDEDVTDEAVQLVESDRRISLVAASGWETVTVTGTIDVPEKVFNATLPYDEREEPPTKLTVAVRASKTILRMGQVGTTFSESIDGPGEYEVSTTLSFSEVRGDVVLKPYVVREESQSSDEDYATGRGDRLASDDAWTVRVDQPDDDGGFLHPLIEPFDKYPTFPSEENVHYLHFENPSTPKLYLNANHGQLIDVLFNEGTRGSDPRFRDVLYDYIEQSVWQQLLVRTANDIDTETGETRHPWQEEVIDIFADHLYDPDDSNEEVASKMASDATSGEDLDRLISEIESAIQKRIDHPDSALKLFQEGLHND